MPETLICESRMQAHGILPTVLSPNGIVNPVTGELLEGVQGQLLDLDRGDSVIANKVCNVFSVTFQIVNVGPPLVVLAGPFTVVVSDEFDCPGAGVLPGTTDVRKQDITVRFCIVPVLDDDGTYFVIVGVIVEYLLQVFIVT